MKFNKLLVSVGTLILVSACSTTPVTKQTAAPVPAEHVYKTSYIGAASSSGATVTFLRDSGFFGSGCSHDVYVDNVKIFTIREGEKITIHVSAGQHLFRLESGGGLCPNISTSQETIVSDGARRTYRILLPSDGSLRLTRVE